MLSKEEYKKYVQMLGQQLHIQQLTGEMLLADGIAVSLELGQPELPLRVRSISGGDRMFLIGGVYD
jgi:hypothetical protein